ncbi:MAG: hypothetical protein MAG795_01077 [Candidatus Woesearchaeota archaeon]|nr:hypothetical protein [Candidatus Woesearchaeota archaeon]
MVKKEVISAVSTLAGAVIGAGVLGIPYVVSQVGLLTGVVDLLLIGILVLFLYLLYGEVTLRTKKTHQLAGYAEQYLGKKAKILAAVSMSIGSYGALIAYLMGVGASMQAIFGGSSLGFSIGFFIIGSFIVYSGIKGVKKSELVLTILIVLSVLIICSFGLKNLNPNNLSGFNIKKLFVPYGVILFAYMGTSAIPEIREELKKNKKELKKSIIWGMSIPILIYLIFTIIVVGIIGMQGFSLLEPQQRIATLALGHHVGQHMFIFGNVFAIFAMAASFIVIAVALMEMFMFDLDMSKSKSFILTLSIPFIVSVTSLTNFIQIIGISGVIVGGINGILIVLMHKRAQLISKIKPEYSIKPLLVVRTIIIILLTMGIIHRLFFLFN